MNPLAADRPRSNHSDARSLRLTRDSNAPQMAEVQKTARVIFWTLTDEEARAKYGSSFVFVGQPVNALRAEEAASRNGVVPLPSNGQPI